MSDDKFETDALQKTCAESGCKSAVGREHDYCFEHRE
ncbi:hypothetical protein HJTV-2_gp56 [Haloarcula virus HJTV-2]|uniref:Uncharacterized protein n=1 Tax=Haloarcula virus HJTV-2 TaxID=2877986 RepID=A0AAE8XWA7_9CAUD|nr:hypothetical protein M1M33_gp091 [Haloarcula virus HJTV-2]UBF21536.1 hypothetical protein HRTV-24_gp50 [Halorubrum virus HRTV-24]UBF21676.1 hypothetical protein HJTV-2_gp56 [Haloarcula virus HJTV-2]